MGRFERAGNRSMPVIGRESVKATGISIVSDIRPEGGS